MRIGKKGRLVLIFAFFSNFLFAKSSSHIVLSQGTYWNFVTHPELRTLDQIELDNQLQNFDKEFSEWNSDSWLRKVENNGFTKPFKASKEFLYFIELTNTLPEPIRRLFDPSVEKHKRKLSSKLGQWADIRILEKYKDGSGLVVFQKDPGALTFGGILKGFEVAYFYNFLIQKGYEVLSIDAGGGNSLNTNSQFLTLHSHSRSHQSHLPSIVHPLQPHSKVAESQFSISCVIEKSQATDSQITRLSTLSDIYSTVSILNKDIELPLGCRKDQIF